MKRIRTYRFPLSRPHHGVPMANGRQGLLIWGGCNQLQITIGRAGFWDHRGGTPFGAAISFREVRELLEAGREEELARRFGAEASPRAYERPCQVGGGRLVISLPSGSELTEGHLDLDSGDVDLSVRTEHGEPGSVSIRQSRSRDLSWVTFAGFEPAGIRLRPQWEWESERLGADGVPAPERWEDERGGGFLQRLPADAGLAVGWRKRGGGLEVATWLGEGGVAEARQGLWQDLPDECQDAKSRQVWWTGFRRTLPEVRLPDAQLQNIWDLQTYKLAGTHPPGAPPGSLQSAWMEDHRLAPWSNDFHFNINLQMLYSPCLGANLPEHFGPLWRMMEGWMPTLQRNGEAFFGAPGALMLPHAVDDRCQVVGTFWSGTIDHACTAWMAHLAWLHYRHVLDEDLLRRVAWPLLRGAFEGFWAMARRRDSGALELPVSVSPEFHAYTPAGPKLWGRNASFQLAAFHRVADLLPRAAAVLGHPVDPRWRDVTENLPGCTVVSGRSHRWGQQQDSVARIGLWEGQDLDESHRHHSHLAGLFPFLTLDPGDPQLRPILSESLMHWLAMGAGKWAGWSFPWAAMICARCDLGDAAVAWLKWWDNVFVNPSGAPLHDADFAGCGVLFPGAILDPESREGEVETMQLEAGCGAVQAILELLVQQRGDVLSFLPTIPSRWRELAFDGVRVEGAFLVGATVTAGRVIQVRVRAEKGGRFCFRIGARGAVREVELNPGETRCWGENELPGLAS